MNIASSTARTSLEVTYGDAAEFLNALLGPPRYMVTAPWCKYCDEPLSLLCEPTASRIDGNGLTADVVDQEPLLVHIRAAHPEVNAK